MTNNVRMTREKIENLALAHRLVVNGMRPKTAAELLRLPASATKAMWAEHHGGSSPRGNTPSASYIDWYLRSHERAASASLLGALLNRIIHVRHEAELDRIESFCTIWEYYQSFILDCGLTLIDINRAWNLLEILESGRLQVLRCSGCDALHLDFPACDRINKNRRQCLFCARLTKASPEVDAAHETKMRCANDPASHHRPTPITLQ
jgi:hypothetical protein